MDLKASSQDLSPSDCASDSEEKEISEGEDEDDDRNHKHRKRETGSQPPDGDFLNQVSTRPYRKRKPFDNGFPYREGDPQSGETSKNHNGASERNFSTRSEKRRTIRTPFSRAPIDLNQRIRGNQSLLGEAGPILGRGMDPLSWALHNSRLGMVDVTTPMVQSGPVPSGLLAGRGLPNISNAHGTPWNAFGMVPGVPNGGLDGLRHIGLQGALRQAINPAINIGLPRQRCRDFEERGFCLRGDMCPMEHGVNRIVVDDVQSLSQFNLPVSLPGSQLLGTSGNGALPVISTSSSTLAKNKAFHVTSGRHGITEDGLGLNGGFVSGSVAVGSDVYDPDQPLWTNNNTEASASLLEVNGSNAGVKESFLDIDPSDQKQIESYERYDEKPIRSVCTSVSQSLSGWGKLASSKGRFGQKNKIDSVGTSSSSIDRDIRSEAAIVGLQAVSQGKVMNVDDNALQVKELSLKPHRDSISNVRKPSQKATRTLFVNGIPLKDNRKEALLSHFQKFGEVIDIYIPMNSERAFVQFSKREEAEAALMAPDAIMGNRFIKLWWANRDNTIDHGLSGNSGLPIMSQRKIDIPAPNGRKENLHAAGGKDDNAHPSVAQVPIYENLKPMAAKVSKTPPQQKKLENLELLKEELRKKQEMLDQKRNEFRLQLDKLAKQSAGPKDVTISDKAFKSLEGGRLPDIAKTETTESPGNHVIAENTISAEHAVQHTTTSKPTIVQPPSLRQIRQPALLGTPYVGNRFKLDNRPTAFRIVAPLPDGLANVATLKEHFSAYGDLSSVELEESKLQKISDDNSVQSDVSALISFTTRRSAERAFLNGKCWQDHNLQLTWLASSNSGREGGIAGNPSASSSLLSEANAHVEPDGDAASIHSQKSDASGCSEPENLTKENEAESMEKREDFGPATTLGSSENNAS